METHNQKMIEICKKDFDEFFVNEAVRSENYKNYKITFLSTIQLKEDEYRYSIFVFNQSCTFHRYIAYAYDNKKKKFIAKFMIGRGA